MDEYLKYGLSKLKKKQLEANDLHRIFGTWAQPVYHKYSAVQTPSANCCTPLWHWKVYTFGPTFRAENSSSELRGESSGIRSSCLCTWGWLKSIRHSHSHMTRLGSLDDIDAWVLHSMVHWHQFGRQTKIWATMFFHLESYAPGTTRHLAEFWMCGHSDHMPQYERSGGAAINMSVLSMFIWRAASTDCSRST